MSLAAPLPEINLVLQTTITAIVLISMAFRVKEKYVPHLATAAAAMIAAFVVIAIAVPGMGDPAYMATLTSPASHMIVFGMHMFLGLTGIVSSVVLVALLAFNWSKRPAFPRWSFAI